MKSGIAQHSLLKEDDDDPEPVPLACLDTVLDVAMHPTSRIACAGIVAGFLEVWRVSDDISVESARVAVVQKMHASTSCRTIAFNSTGRNLFSGGANGSLHGVDASRGDVVWTVKQAHPSSVNRVSTCLSDSVGPWALLSGDENGEICLWDARVGAASRSAATSVNAHTDFVADMVALDDKRVVSVGGDGRLSQVDLRKTGGLKVTVQSEEAETELLSVVSVKEGKKLVVGTQEGPLLVFSQGKLAAPTDSFPGHPNSVDALLKYDEDVVLTGSSDGIIRIVQLFPHKIKGVIGFHDDFPVERLTWSHDREFIASCSHDNLVRFWDMRFLASLEGDEQDDDAMEVDAASSAGGAAASAQQKHKRAFFGAMQQADDDMDDL